MRLFLSGILSFALCTQASFASHTVCTKAEQNLKPARTYTEFIRIAHEHIAKNPEGYKNKLNVSEKTFEILSKTWEQHQTHFRLQELNNTVLSKFIQILSGPMITTLWNIPLHLLAKEYGISNKNLHTIMSELRFMIQTGDLKDSRLSQSSIYTKHVQDRGHQITTDGKIPFLWKYQSSASGITLLMAFLLLLAPINGAPDWQLDFLGFERNSKLEPTGDVEKFVNIFKAGSILRKVDPRNTLWITTIDPIKDPHQATPRELINFSLEFFIARLFYFIHKVDPRKSNQYLKFASTPEEICKHVSEWQGPRKIKTLVFSAPTDSKARLVFPKNNRIDIKTFMDQIEASSMCGKHLAAKFEPEPNLLMLGNIHANMDHLNSKSPVGYLTMFLMATFTNHIIPQKGVSTLFENPLYVNDFSGGQVMLSESLTHYFQLENPNPILNKIYNGASFIDKKNLAVPPFIQLLLSLRSLNKLKEELAQKDDVQFYYHMLSPNLKLVPTYDSRIRARE